MSGQVWAVTRTVTESVIRVVSGVSPRLRWMRCIGTFERDRDGPATVSQRAPVRLPGGRRPPPQPQRFSVAPQPRSGVLCSRGDLVRQDFDELGRGSPLPAWNQVTRGVMAAGSDLVILAAASFLCVTYVVVRHRYRLAASVVLAVVASTLIAGLLKQICERARPPASMALIHVSGLSMASTDAALVSAGAATLCVGLSWLHPRRRRIARGVLAAGVAAIGLCLIYLGVHWPRMCWRAGHSASLLVAARPP